MIPTCALTLVAIGLGVTPACSKIIGIDDVAVRDSGPGVGRSPSCMGLPATCGAGANEDCCQTAAAPGTEPGSRFYRSYDEATDAYNDTSFPATVSTFVLDRYEVTVGRFRAFVDAGMGTQATPPVVGAGAHPNLADSGWDSAWNTNLVTGTSALKAALQCFEPLHTWTDAPEENENKPMDCVSWYEAMAFCIWDGGYLPTEMEWNYAASGGSEHRAYPWSKPASSLDVNCTYANYINNGAYCIAGPTGGTGAKHRVGNESPKGDGRWSHSDLGGNVWEWVLDWYATGYPLPCNDCANLMDSSGRAIRGGSYSLDESRLRTGIRSSWIPGDRYHAIGLRCARAP